MNLKTLRIKAGWSQEFVSKMLNVSRNTIKNWEDNATEPSASMAVKIAKLFGITVEELMK